MKIPDVRIGWPLIVVASLLACNSSTPQSAQLPMDAAPAKAAAPAEPASNPDGARASPEPAGGAPENAAAGKGSSAVDAASPRGAWPGAELVAAANLDGEGHDELVVWSAGALSIWTVGDEHPYELALPRNPDEPRVAGAPSHIAVADLDADGRDDVLLGFGQARGALDVPVTLVALRVKGESGKHRRVLSVLYQVPSPRAQVCGLLIRNLLGDGRPEILLAYYDSKYFSVAQALFLGAGKDPLEGPLRAEPLGRVRMGASWEAGSVSPRGKSAVLVGRPYGEEKLAPGDLFWLEGDKREPIPTTLGVRSVTLGDGDGDGSQEVYFGDGWHFEYGKKARGRLNVAHKVDGRWLTELIEDTRGQYEIKKIQIADVDGDQKPELIVAGNEVISLYWKVGPEWQVRTLTRGDDFTLARLPSGPALVMPGSTLRVLPLNEVRVGGQPVSKQVSPPGVDRQP